MIVNVTKEQAQVLKHLYEQQTISTERFALALEAMTVGHVPAGSRLEAIEPQDGTLVFADEKNG